MAFRGGCLCGQVRYEVAGEPIAFMLCHCRDCQYLAGGEPQAGIVVARTAFRLLQGTLTRYAKTGDSGATITRSFCPTCGTQLFGELSANPDLWIIKAGTMDDAHALKPSAFIWTQSALPWAHRDQNIRSFEKGPQPRGRRDATVKG